MANKLETAISCISYIYDALKDYSKIISSGNCNDCEKMSDAYRESIIDEVLRICNGLKTYTPGPNEFLSDGISRYSHGNKKPMRSLRDTEDQVTIRID